MDAIEACVQAATRRLRDDPELRMDIAHELRTHIEDRIEAAKAAGEGEQNSIVTALKAFGDPETVGEEIWKANRGRMRLRAWVKWGARVTLVPAVLVMALVLLYFAVITGVGCLVIANQLGESSALYADFLRSDAMRQWVQRSAERPFKSGITEREKLVYQGGPGVKTWLDKARRIVETDPTNPVYYGRYAIWWIHDMAHLIKEQGEERALKETLAMLDRGEQLEPDNAFYNYMKAAMLLERGATWELDESRSYTVTVRGRQRIRHPDKLILKDRRLVEQAVRELLKGTRKSTYDSHVMDFALLRQGLLQEPDSLVQELGRIQDMAGQVLPDLSRFRDMIRGAEAYAGFLAEEGRQEEALAILERIRVPALQLGSSTDLLITVLVAHSMLVAPLEKGAFVYDTLNMKEAAAQARAEAREEQQCFESLTTRSTEHFSDEEIEKNGGMLLAITLPAIYAKRDPEMLRPWRLVERVLFERAMLTAVFVALMVILLALLLRTFGMLVGLRRRAEVPKLFFPGWKRLAWVIGVSVVLPLAAYYVYSRWMPFGGLGYGINYRPERLVLEFSVLGVAIIVLSTFTTYRAIRARCKEAGMPVPALGRLRPGWFWRITVALCVIPLVVYAFTWQAEQGRVIGVLMPAALGFLTLAWLLATGWRMFKTCSGRLVHFRRTFVRTAVPLLAAILLCLGGIAHIYCRLAERHYVHLTQRPGRRIFTDEVQMSGFADYRDHLAERYRSFTQEPTGPRAPTE